MHKKIAKALPRPAILTLDGDLGAGRQFSVEALQEHLELPVQLAVRHLILCKEYDLEDGVLYHMDLYRIGDDDEAIAFGIDEYLQRSDAACLIEWSSRLEWLLPDVVYNIKIEHVSESQRRIILSDNLRDLL